jgi:hypothetical protein
MGGARLRAIADRAGALLAEAETDRVGSARRPIAERLNQVIDSQRAPPHEGSAAPLAAPVPDAIPMTGEEDPLVEVDDPEFAAVVAEYMRSEHRADAAHGESSRVILAQALVPFAEDDTGSAALLRAIEGPFERYAAALASSRGGIRASDAALLESLIAIVDRQHGETNE